MDNNQLNIYVTLNDIYYFDENERKLFLNKNFSRVKVESLIYEELSNINTKDLIGLSKRFIELIKINEVINESQKSNNFLIKIMHYDEKNTFRFPWNLLYFKYNNISVVYNNSYDCYKQLQKIILYQVNLLIIVNNSYFTTDEDQLLFEHELYSLKKELGGFKNYINIKILYTPTLEELMTVLKDHQFNIIHYIGHTGYVSKNDKIYFYIIDKAKIAIQFEIKEFDKLLINQSSLFFLFFNSCQSGYPTTNFENSIASFKSLNKNISIISMRYSIEDQVGFFIGKFYKDFFNNSLLIAFNNLIKNLKLNNIKIFLSPILIYNEKKQISLEDITCNKIQNINEEKITFIGRERELNLLNNLLKTHEKINIYGAHKIGKTSLIKYFLKRYNLPYDEIKRKKFIIYQFNFNRNIKIIVESDLKIDNINQFNNIIHLQIPDLSKKEAILMVLLKHNQDINKLKYSKKINVFPVISKIRNPYLLNFPLSKIFGIAQEQYKLDKLIFSNDELGLIHLLIMSPFSLTISNFEILLKMFLLPKNYKTIYIKYTNNNWITIVDDNIYLTSHVFLNVIKDKFQGLDKIMMEQNCKALLYILDIKLKEYSFGKKEFLINSVYKHKIYLYTLLNDNYGLQIATILFSLSLVEISINKNDAYLKLEEEMLKYGLKDSSDFEDRYKYNFIMAMLYERWNVKELSKKHYKKTLKYFIKINGIKNNDGYSIYGDISRGLGNQYDGYKMQLKYYRKALKFYKKSGFKQKIESCEKTINSLERGEKIAWIT